MIANSYIFRTDCPTEAEWKSRSIELCKMEPQKYHCIYNRDCQLVEFCAEKKYNDFEIYLIYSGQEFLLQKQNIIETNDMQYWLIQYNIYCKSKIASATGQPITTVDNRENIVYKTPGHCFVGWILFVIVSLAGIGQLIYIVKNKRNGNKETRGKTGDTMKLSAAVYEKTPVSERTESIYVGNDGTLRGRNISNDSQNSNVTLYIID